MGELRAAAAHGKLLLFGEHAAVHGKPALGIPLSLRTAVKWSPSDGGFDLGAVDKRHRKVFAALLSRMAPREAGGRIQVESDVPKESGLGSSAALCAALARLFRPDAPFSELWRAANDGERLFHGRPSGIDTGLALSDAPTAFLPSSGELPKAVTLAGKVPALVAGVISRTSDTKTLVMSLSARIDAREKSAIQGLERLGELALEAIRLLEDGRASGDAFGKLADRAQETLASLGLSTGLMDRLLEEGRKLGACGGKLSGAGGGGAFWFSLPEGADAEGFCMKLAARQDATGLIFLVRPFAVT